MSAHCRSSTARTKRSIGRRRGHQPTAARCSRFRLLDRVEPGDRRRFRRAPRPKPVTSRFERTRQRGGVALPRRRATGRAPRTRCLHGPDERARRPRSGAEYGARCALLAPPVREHTAPVCPTADAEPPQERRLPDAGDAAQKYAPHRRGVPAASRTSAQLRQFPSSADHVAIEIERRSRHRRGRGSAQHEPRTAQRNPGARTVAHVVSPPDGSCSQGQPQIAAPKRPTHSTVPRLPGDRRRITDDPPSAQVVEQPPEHRFGLDVVVEADRRAFEPSPIMS